MRHILRIFLFALLGSGYLVGRAITPQHQTVVFLGDSITEDWSVSAAFPSVTTINAGVSGQTTAQMLARFNSDVVAHHPTHVVILGGTNDLQFSVPNATTESNIDGMVNTAQAAGIQPVLSSILPSVSSWLPIPLTPTLIAPLNTWIQGEAAAKGIPYANYSAFDPNTMTSDGLHPNSTGYSYMQGVLSAFVH